MFSYLFFILNDCMISDYAAAISNLWIWKFVEGFISIVKPTRRTIFEHQVYVIQQAATEPVWHIPDAVCTVLNSWWWTERPSETCRVIFNKLENCASSWFYYRNISRCMVTWTSKLWKQFSCSNVRYFRVALLWRNCSTEHAPYYYVCTVSHLY
jgi:hypothetical protein